MKRIVLYLLFIGYQSSFAQTFILERPPHHAVELTVPRLSSFPYLSSDTYRMFCDFSIDERKIPFSPENVNDGDTIFLSTYDLQFFFTIIHPCIRKHYILVTHHSDASAPGEFVQYLNDEKLAAWFGQNCDIIYHPKFFPMPIGLANQYWPWGNIDILNQERESIPLSNRDIFVYMNFNSKTNKSEREQVLNYFKNKSFCAYVGAKDFRSYLRDLKRAQFVVSPPGNGLDCHRHWESLIMGAIPIIKHSTLDPLFEDLPVLLINDWTEITEEFLQSMYEKIQSQKTMEEKLFAPYWFDKINHVKEAVKKRYSKYEFDRTGNNKQIE